MFFGHFSLTRGPLVDHTGSYFVISCQTKKAVQYVLALGLDYIHTKFHVNIFKTEILINFQSRSLKIYINDPQSGTDPWIPNLLCIFVLLHTLYMHTKFEVNWFDFDRVITEKVS
jgi:hypothetical protein